MNKIKFMVIAFVLVLFVSCKDEMKVFDTNTITEDANLTEAINERSVTEEKKEQFTFADEDTYLAWYGTRATTGFKEIYESGDKFINKKVDVYLENTQMRAKILDIIETDSYIKFECYVAAHVNGSDYFNVTFKKN